jgi:hypothetical protein
MPNTHIRLLQHAFEPQAAANIVTITSATALPATFMNNAG